MLRLLAIFLVLLPSVALGHAAVTPGCGPAAFVEQVLQTQYKEEQMAVGVTLSEKLVERWESEAGSWTITLRPTREILCVILFGENWRELSKFVPSLVPAKRDNEP